MLVDADVPSASENPRLGTARMTMVVVATMPLVAADSENQHLGTARKTMIVPAMPLVDAEVPRASENPHLGTARKTLNTLVPAMPMCDASCSCDADVC
jgi:hypothetical protein